MKDLSIEAATKIYKILQRLPTEKERIDFLAQELFIHFQGGIVAACSMSPEDLEVCHAGIRLAEADSEN